MGQKHAFLWQEVSEIFPESQSLAIKDAPAGLKQHLSSLRIEDGEEIQALNGAGKIITLKISGDLKRGSFNFVSEKTIEKPQDSLALWIAAPKKDALADVLSMATELGVSEIRFLRSEHVQHRLQDEDAIYDRAQRVVQAACEQCVQPWMPKTVNETWPSPADAVSANFGKDFTTFVANENLSMKNLPLGIYLGSKPQNLQNFSSSSSRRLILLIGPEGGWSKTEDAFFEKTSSEEKNFYQLSLGALILRAPTATAAAITLIKRI